MKCTLKLPARVDVELNERDIADAIEAVNAPFLVGEHRGVPMKDLITDRMGNVYRRPAGGSFFDAKHPLPVVFKASQGRAALVDAYHTLKFQQLNHHGGDPLRELAEAAKAVLDQAGNGFPIRSADDILSHLRAAVAKAEGR